MGNTTKYQLLQFKRLPFKRVMVVKQGVGHHVQKCAHTVHLHLCRNRCSYTTPPSVQKHVYTVRLHLYRNMHTLYAFIWVEYCCGNFKQTLRFLPENFANV